MTGPCDARIAGVCAGVAQHHHHRKLRRHGDERPVNLLAVCFACHEHIHRNPAWSKSWGLMVPSWNDPADIHPEAGSNPTAWGPNEQEPNP